MEEKPVPENHAEEKHPTAGEGTEALNDTEVDLSEEEYESDTESEEDAKHDDKKKKRFKKRTEEDKLREKIKALETSLLAKDKEIADQKSKFAFLQAELDNTRKHYQKQAESSKLRTKADVLTAFTPVIDAFELAFKNKDQFLKHQTADAKCSIDKFVQGFENIHAQFNSILDSFHVKPIKDINVPFDYKIHEVMMKIINDAIPEDTVVNVVQKGYTINNEVIRPAMVIVTKHTPPPPPVEEVKEEVQQGSESPNASPTISPESIPNPGPSPKDAEHTPGSEPPVGA